MENVLKNYQIAFHNEYMSVFQNRYGIYQDGTTPMCRDKDGKLWAISGHSHCGHIAMFSGTCVQDLKQLYPIELNFCVGHADFAFDGVRYPDGVKARGSIWPFGFYICPKTHRFFAFFHNETGWAGRGTAYDAFGLCNTPKYDSDFRHVGLMHSDDEGKTWSFDRWVLSGENVCFTDRYNPEKDIARGQSGNVIALGSGDFTFFIDENQEFFYIFYNLIHVDLDSGFWPDCHVYVARSRLRDDGIFGDFVKYYNGAFCEAGNFGKETPIAKNAWHARVVYMEELKTYVLSSVPVNNDKIPHLADTMQIQTSDCSLTEWSEPIPVQKDGKLWGNHYVALVNTEKDGQPYHIRSTKCAVLSNHNGTDVLCSEIEFMKK